ncbi:MAG: DUF1028 domain-containing protein [Gemmataceae bacterium]|nr:DUF1028 domain-containing protein [Gemmataceae bacterium]
MRRDFRPLVILSLLSLCLVALISPSSGPPPVEAQPAQVCANTFSIVAYDPERKEWGVATASCVLAVGAAVPFAKAPDGAIASQSLVNPTYGPKGLELLAAGKSAAETLKTLTDADEGRELRQLAVIDGKGNIAHFTGKKCSAWAGVKEGKGYVCIGNLLAGEAVVEQMAKTFEENKGSLAWRMMLAMEAGEKAGGDKRGKQSAAILVARERNSFAGRSVDLRVDDHEKPIQELQRILAKQTPRPRD